ncbi:MAG: Gfo/Idh/MocA family oxidoreductase [Thaumarchaeota archaeon]|nr:Gfo/Idh/MocA family oxidoreductase [Nitrososphaerota archaeon]
MSKKKGDKLLRFAVIGSGYMGRSYVEGITKYDTRTKLVAVHGGSRAPQLAKDYGVDYEPSYEKLLKRDDVDAVLIATPHGEHAEETILAAEHGKHVLVEKAMATTVKDCDAMIAACKKAGVYLEVIKTGRFRGVPLRAQKLVEEGAIGKLRMIRGSWLFTVYVDHPTSWLNDPKHGGALMDMGTHNFDSLRHFAKSEIKSVYSTVKTYGKSRLSDLNAMTQVVMQNGVMCQLWMAFEMPEPSLPDFRSNLTLVGDKGMIDMDGYGKLNLAKGGKWETVWTMPPIDYINRPLDPIRLEAFYMQVQLFIDDVLDHRPPTVTGWDGRQAVEGVIAAKLSSERNKVVDLPLPKGKY